MKRVACFALGALAVGYALLLWSLSAMPFQDLPNHVARAVVMADLTFHSGERFGEVFSFEFMFVPYILGDIVLMYLVEVLGADTGARVWLILVAASLPLAVGAYLRSAGYSKLSILIGCLLSLYLATDWFFIMGFENFRVAIAMVVLGLAVWQAFMRTGSVSSYFLFMCLFLAGYLMHLSALVFFAAGVGAVSLFALAHRKVSLPRAVAGGVLIAALFGWHFFYSGAVDGGQVTEWASIVGKISRTMLPFFYFSRRSSVVLLGLFLSCCTLMLASSRRAWNNERFQNACVLAIAFLLVYAVLPVETSDVWEIDSRALPLAWLFVLFAALASAEPVRAEKTVVLAAAVLLAVTKLYLLWAHLEPLNSVMIGYREVAAQLPHGARVLTIDLPNNIPYTHPFLHAGAFATIEASGVTPYLFAGNIGAPNKTLLLKYFRYKTLPYAPSEDWYGNDLRVDWPKIKEKYDYILIRLPFDAKRIGVETQVVSQNRHAALLKVLRYGS